MKTSEKLLDKKIMDRKEWITEDTWNKIKERKGREDKIHMQRMKKS
jgi:hypothetical protein